VSDALFVGGSFNASGGHRSRVVESIREGLVESGLSVRLVNGGDLDALSAAEPLAALPSPEVIIWFPDVSNDLDKSFMSRCKVLHPKAVFVVSKRNEGPRVAPKYSRAELIVRMLQARANLMVEFDVTTREFVARVLDPLGNVFFEGVDMRAAGRAMGERILFLLKLSRVGSVASGEPNSPPDTPETRRFAEIVRGYGDVWMNIIQPADLAKARFLGNASYRFRCTHGFPSFRASGATHRPGPDLVYVSRRNVDKEGLSPSDFVGVSLVSGETSSGDRVAYDGERKPSVDTPIQLRLYAALPRVRWMVHSHCYVEGAAVTARVLPCGAVEEAGEVLEAIAGKESEEPILVNLKGHGSLVMARDLESLVGVKFTKVFSWPAEGAKE